MSTKGLIAFCYRSSDGCAMIARPYLTYLQCKAERNLGTRIDKACKVQTVVNSRFSRDVTAAMSVYRTIPKKVFWEFDSIIMQNLSDILPLFCTPTWPSHHVSENQEFLCPEIRLSACVW